MAQQQQIVDRRVERLRCLRQVGEDDQGAARRGFAQWLRVDAPGVACRGLEQHGDIAGPAAQRVECGVERIDRFEVMTGDVAGREQRIDQPRSLRRVGADEQDLQGMAAMARRGGSVTACSQKRSIESITPR